eukprot:s8353_g4.t1
MKWTIQVAMIPHGDMPVDDEDMPTPQGQHPEPDLDDDPIELDTGGDPPSQPPGGGAQVPVPGGEHDDSDLDVPVDPDDAGDNPPPGGGPQGPGPGCGPSPDDWCGSSVCQSGPGIASTYAVAGTVCTDCHVPVPIPPRPHFPVPQSLRPPSARNVSQTRARGVHPDGLSKAKSRTVGPPVVLLPGESAGKKEPHSSTVLNLLPRRLVQLRFLVCL